MKVCTVFNSLRIGFSVAGSRKYSNEPSGFIKGWGISWLVERLLASQKGPCPTESVTCRRR